MSSDLLLIFSGLLCKTTLIISHKSQQLVVLAFSIALKSSIRLQDTQISIINRLELFNSVIQCLLTASALNLKLNIGS
jgi:hypothetical protein